MGVRREVGLEEQISPSLKIGQPDIQSELKGLLLLRGHMKHKYETQILPLHLEADCLYLQQQKHMEEP